MAALMAVVMLREMMINQTNLWVQPVVSLNSVTPNAVLVHPIEVRVVVARLLMMMMNFGRL